MGQTTTVIPTGGGGAKVQDTEPTNPSKGDLWVDTSESVPATKWYSGTSWKSVEGRIGSVSNATDLPSGDPAQIYYNKQTGKYLRSVGPPWDISTASYTGTSINTQESRPRGIAWKPDGSMLFELGNMTDKIYEYSVSTSWDISTASYTGNSINTQDGNTTGIAWKPDGSMLFEVGNGDNKIYEYQISYEAF